MSEQEHRPEPFTTLQGLVDEGIPAKVYPASEEWLMVEGAEEVIKVINRLEYRGLVEVDLVLPIAPGMKDYNPICVTASAMHYAKGLGRCLKDFETSTRYPVLYFSPKLDGKKFPAFIDYAFREVLS